VLDLSPNVNVNYEPTDSSDSLPCFSINKGEILLSITL
jgi:hypothetical protein